MKKLAFLLFFITSFLGQQSYACSCAEVSKKFKKKVKHSFESSEYLFSGLVIDVEKTNTGIIQSSADAIIYTFEVVESYKGIYKKRTIKIKSQQDGASCGYIFKQGQTYLVHGNDFRDAIWTGLCRRNNEIRNVSKKELRLLKRYKRRSI